MAALVAVHLGVPPPGLPGAAATAVARTALPAGRPLVRYVVSVPPYYGLVFAATVSRPFDTRAGRAADLLNRLYDYETRDAFVHVPREPTYPLCRSGHEFTRVVVAELHKSFCYLGHGLLVGITVTAMGAAQHTFLITVWQA
ncbi:hypothetical protein Rhe02_75500 [Rhizocola hellebori]|uniref:Uncharacterized protein n=1 Tax=Rhizocola hellebori TaxID=1392758 RepID=A0A8J3QEN2_9ACTN|nr:hypothetical protein [Rhizocola hellebori]GIH09483.1 hypothetical protein Rhe02_75500 [Rhizocola hellebori]